jgi:ABC-type oligopeptide transport system, ATPase component
VSLISAENLKKYFPIRGIFRISGYLRAVDGVSIEVKREETVESLESQEVVKLR